MTEIDLHAYGPTVAELLHAAPVNELGPGKPNKNAQVALRELTPEQLVAPRRLVDRDMGLACLSGLWLRHDYLDESHSISQAIDTQSGSYWHGIMHRREPDYENAKYWFRRVKAHEIFDPLCVAARQLQEQAGVPAADYLSKQTTWDPFRFVELCEMARGGALAAHCQQIQLREWQLLFDFCFRRAVGE